MLKKGIKYSLWAIKCKLGELYHDVPNCFLEWEYEGLKGIYIIDASNVDGIIAKNYDLYLIESNYKEEILQKNKMLKDANLEYDYLYRVENSHLSYEQAMDFLLNNMGNNSEYELLHKSELNFEEGREQNV